MSRPSALFSKIDVYVIFTTGCSIRENRVVVELVKVNSNDLGNRPFMVVVEDSKAATNYGFDHPRAQSSSHDDSHVNE